MPNTKKEKIMFSILMSGIMVYGMEVYNKFFLDQSFTVGHFLLEPVEFVLLMLTVILLETLIGGPLARKLAFRLLKRQKGSEQPGKEERPWKTIIVIQVCTVCMMCPMMSLVAAVFFKCGVAPILPFVWIQTVGINIIMALVWQLLVAGPCVRFMVLGSRKCIGIR